MVDMAALNAKLAVLKQTYAVQLPGKIAEIDAVWQSLSDGNWDHEQLHTLHRLVHSLTGSGKTFGFPELSDAARRMEQELKALLQNNEMPSADKIAEIQLLFDVVKKTATV